MYKLFFKKHAIRNFLGCINITRNKTGSLTCKQFKKSL